MEKRFNASNTVDASGLHSSVGTLKYSYNKDYGYKLVVIVDPGISLLYRWLIPKWFVKQPQKYPAHITLVRKEVPTNLKVWGRHEGKKITFFYSPNIKCDDKYWWLDVYSSELEDIRSELGLSNTSKYTKPPDGFSKCFHITIANRKEVKYD